MKALLVVSDKQAAHHGCSGGVTRYNGKYIHNREIAKKVRRGIVENPAYRILCASHDSFHSVDRSQVVTAIDAVRAARSHQNVLVVVRHPDNFVRHNLSDR